jgi:pilus assembly protein CpaE
VGPPWALTTTASLRILVYSPDVEVGHLLAEALRAEAPRLEIQLNERYPTEREIEMSDQREIGAVVVGLTSGPAGLQVIRSLRSVAPELPTVAVGKVESSNDLLDAMRAGATDYLWPPFDSQRLANLLSSLPNRAGRAKANRLICFAPCQSTDGASTTALHVAHAMTKIAGIKPLLLDCDIHSSTLMFRLGAKFDFHIGDALERLSDLDDIWGRVAADWHGFRILACPTEGEPPTEILRRRLPDVVASAMAAHEAVIADLPSSFSPTIAETARLAERPYLVCTPQLVSIHLARRRLDEMKALGVDLANIRLIVNRSDSRGSVSKSTIEDALGMAIDFSLPNDFAAVNQAAYPPSRLCKSLKSLMLRIEQVCRLDEWPPRAAAAAD